MNQEAKGRVTVSTRSICGQFDRHFAKPADIETSKGAEQAGIRSLDLWLSGAVTKIQANFQRSAHTHLFKLAPPKFRDVDICLKDKGTHPAKV